MSADNMTRKILFLVAHPVEDASCRYRVHQFVPLLERAGYECTVSAFSTPQLFRSLRSKGRLGTKLAHTLYCTARRLLRLASLNQFDLIVIHREVFPFFTPRMEHWVLRQSEKVIFSFDDAIFAGHDDVSALNHPLLYRLKYGRGVDEVLRRSRLVIAGNRFLADYARRFNSRVSIVPTVVDCAKFRCKEIRGGVSPLTIGWIGSRSTVPYLSRIEPALRRLAEAHPGRVRFRFFGCQEYRPDIPQSASLPFQLASEVDDLSSLDIGLMPMPDGVWARGKCAFKAIQYMALGIPTVASPVGATVDLIRHDHNGLLASSLDQWYRALDYLINDTEARRRLSVSARQTIEQSYSLQVWGLRMVSLLEGLLPQIRIKGHEPMPIDARALPQNPILNATRKAV